MTSTEVAGLCSGEQLALLAQKRDGRILLIRRVEESPFFELPQAHLLTQDQDPWEALARFTQLLRLLHVHSLNTMRVFGSLTSECNVGTLLHLWKALQAEGEGEPNADEQKVLVHKVSKNLSHVWLTQRGLESYAERTRALPQAFNPNRDPIPDVYMLDPRSLALLEAATVLTPPSIG